MKQPILAAVLSALAPALDAQGHALQPRLEALGVGDAVREALDDGAPRPGPEVMAKGLRAPGLITELRGAVGPALDPLLERLDVPATGAIEWPDVDRMLTVLAGSGRPIRQRPFGELNRYVDVLERAHRDLAGQLGSGLEVFEVAPRLHALLDRLLDATTVPAEEDEALAEVLDRLRQVDRAGVLEGGRAVVAATLALAADRVAIARMGRETLRRSNLDYVVGEVLVERDTAFGRLVVGGPGPNTYDCSQVDVIIDLGGDDRYEGPAGATLRRRRLGVVLDLAGDDVYRCGNDALGSGTYGIGVLVDVEGNDSYEAERRSAGFGAAGFGAFLDLAGNDELAIHHHGGGAGVAGYGVHWDRAGNDLRTARSHGFGLGLPIGVGLLVDGDGADRSEIGATEVGDGGPRGTVALSAGFGVGVGLTGKLDGGIGVVVDGGGDDLWTAKGLTLGSAVRGGVGVFVERAGRDSYEAGTGAVGSAYEHGLGVFFDAAGDDNHTVTAGFGLGAAATGGQAWCVDLDGADRYRLMGLGLGDARPGAVAGFLDLAGEDEYLKEDARDLPWALRGAQEDATAKGVGLFVDEGGHEDRYRWKGTLPPANGEERRSDAGPLTVRADG